MSDSIEAQLSESISFNLNTTQPLMIVVSGPSGVGKDSVLQVLKQRGLPLHFVVTSTDRKPRVNEVDGVDYNFISTEKFQQMIANDEFVEWAVVYGDLKGIPKPQIREAMASGKDVILRVDVQGAARLRQLCPEAVLIFLVPASVPEWFQRLRDRKTETEESLRRRVETAKKELDHLKDFDYVVINADDQLDLAVEKIIEIVEVEHLRVHPRKITL